MVKRIVRILCVLLLIWSSVALAAGRELAEIPEEGIVMGHRCPEAVLFEAERPTESQIRTSAAGLEFLKRHEGFVANSYGDYSQTSIGYGTSTDYARKYGFPTDVITKEQAHDLLVCVVYEMEQVLDTFLKNYQITVSQTQYDALLSFTYNNGTGWLRPGYRLSNHLINGGYSNNAFASAMGIWCHVTQNGQSVILDGLVNRRLDEVTLFLAGAYTRAESELQFCTLRYTGNGNFDNDIDFFQKGEPYGAFSVVTPLDNALPYFQGWYTEAGVRILESTIVTKDLIVQPRWGLSADTGAYEIVSLTALDEAGKPVESIPNGGFYAEVSVYKACEAGESTLLLVTYTAEGQMLDTVFLRANVPGGMTYSLGAWVDNPDGRVGMVKAVLLPSLSAPTPLTAAAELKK